MAWCANSPTLRKFQSTFGGWCCSRDFEKLTPRERAPFENRPPRTPQEAVSVRNKLVESDASEIEKQDAMEGVASRGLTSCTTADFTEDGLGDEGDGAEGTSSAPMVLFREDDEEQPSSSMAAAEEAQEAITLSSASSSTALATLAAEGETHHSAAAVAAVATDLLAPRGVVMEAEACQEQQLRMLPSMLQLVADEHSASAPGGSSDVPRPLPKVPSYTIWDSLQEEAIDVTKELPGEQNQVHLTDEQSFVSAIPVEDCSQIPSPLPDIEGVVEELSSALLAPLSAATLSRDTFISQAVRGEAEVAQASAAATVPVAAAEQEAAVDVELEPSDLEHQEEVADAAHACTPAPPSEDNDDDYDNIAVAPAPPTPEAVPTDAPTPAPPIEDANENRNDDDCDSEQDEVPASELQSCDREAAAEASHNEAASEEPLSLESELPLGAEQEQHVAVAAEENASEASAESQWLVATEAAKEEEEEKVTAAEGEGAKGLQSEVVQTSATPFAGERAYVIEKEEAEEMAEHEDEHHECESSGAASSAESTGEEKDSAAAAQPAGEELLQEQAVEEDEEDEEKADKTAPPPAHVACEEDSEKEEGESLPPAEEAEKDLIIRSPSESSGSEDAMDGSKQAYHPPGQNVEQEHAPPSPSEMDEDEKESSKSAGEENRREKYGSLHAQSASGGDSEVLESDASTPRLPAVSASASEHEKESSSQRREGRVSDAPSSRAQSLEEEDRDSVAPASKPKPASREDSMGDLQWHDCEEPSEAAERMLTDAISNRSIHMLKDAIEEALTCGLSSDDVVEAKRVLAEEELKDVLRSRLQEAMGQRKSAELESALQFSKAVGLGERDIAAARELLWAIQSKAKDPVTEQKAPVEPSPRSSHPRFEWRIVTSRTGNITITAEEFNFFEEVFALLRESISHYGLATPLSTMNQEAAEETLKCICEEWISGYVEHGGDRVFVERRRFMSFGSTKVLEVFVGCETVHNMYISIQWPWDLTLKVSRAPRMQA